MNFALIYPLGLAALAALLVPLALHLIRRAEFRTTPFAAMRWIRSQVRQQHRLRLRDIPLLLLRLLLLALIAILLAQPVLRGDVTAAKHWVLVAPGVDISAARVRMEAATRDSTNADWRWLAPGFPTVSDTAPPGTSDSASLLREADAELPASSRISVVVPGMVDGLDGERPSLSREVEWIVVDGAMPAMTNDRDAVQTHLSVRYDETQRTTAGYLDALQKAWRVDWPDVSMDRAGIDATLPSDTGWLLWLSSERPASLQRWIENGGIAIATPAADSANAVDNEPVWRNADQDVIASSKRIGRGRLISLSAALTPAKLPVLLDADFPRRLHDLFAGARPAPTRAVAAALKPLQAPKTESTATASLATQTPLDAWFALVIAILFVIERIWANRRRGAKT